MMKAALALLVAALTGFAAADNHLRTLQKETTAAIGGDGGVDSSFSGCFSALSTVNVLGQGPVHMQNLQLGDRILTATGNYEPVYAFAHYDTTTQAQFLKIHTTTSNNNNPLEMTGEHLVYMQGKRNPVRADSLRVGDALRGHDSAQAVVTKMTVVERTGLYAPMTTSGSVVVDGIHASSYVSLQDPASVEFGMLQGGIASPLSHHDAIHMFLSPLRMLCSTTSSSFCESYSHNSGYHRYVAFGVYVMNTMDGWNIGLQIIMLVVFCAVMGSIYAVECIFGTVAAPFILVGAAAGYAVVKTSGVVQKQKAKRL